MAYYFWDFILDYPVESTIVISFFALLYIGWVKKFWYLHKPSLYCTKMGEWRVRRFVGRIVEFETEDGKAKLTEKWKKAEEETIMIRIYIGGQPVRRLILNNKDIYSIRRVPKKLFKKEITMDRKHLVWISELTSYVLSDETNPIYIIKPHIFEKSMLKKIDNMDIKSSRGSKVSPPLVHSSYFNNHLPIPPDEYAEKDKSLQISPYAYSTKDGGSYGTYDDLMSEDDVDAEDDVDDNIEPEGKPRRARREDPNE